MTKEIFVTESFMPGMNEYINEIQDLWDSHWLTNMGAKHRCFQQQLQEYLQVEQVELLTNGHMALELSIQALGLSGEVITTPYTFASTTHAIVRNGLTPVFCDINEEDFNIDVTKIEELITDRTCAILPVHVYGNICNVEEIEKIAKKHGLKVIYDAAHAFGVTYKGKGIGSYGDVSCFSFHATKVFHSIEGGAACFKDEDFARALYGLKNFGIRSPEVVDGVGANAKMNEFCAAMGICNLRHIAEEIEKRKAVTERYRSWLKDIPGIRLNRLQPDVQHNYGYFPVVFEEKVFGGGRDAVCGALEDAGIHGRKYFYPITSAFQCYEGMFVPEETPVALQVSEQVLTLPLYGALPLETVDRICEMILSCKR